MDRVKGRAEMANWHIAGTYFETCNCEFICPCIGSNLTARPTEGDCKAALAFAIKEGDKDGTRLGGLNFVIVLRSPGAMADGNIKVGLILDERADAKQAEAITAIASGAVGGPMAALGPLVSEMAGVEKRPIQFGAHGLSYSMTAGELIDQACEGIPSVVKEGEPVYIDNTCHPVNAKLALAKAMRSRFNVFGIKWNDTSGSKNGHFAPFAWSG